MIYTIFAIRIRCEHRNWQSMSTFLGYVCLSIGKRQFQMSKTVKYEVENNEKHETFSLNVTVINQFHFIPFLVAFNWRQITIFFQFFCSSVYLRVANSFMFLNEVILSRHLSMSVSAILNGNPTSRLSGLFSTDKGNHLKFLELHCNAITWKWERVSAAPKKSLPFLMNFLNTIIVECI